MVVILKFICQDFVSVFTDQWCMMYGSNVAVNCTYNFCTWYHSDKFVASQNNNVASIFADDTCWRQPVVVEEDGDDCERGWGVEDN